MDQVDEIKSRVDIVEVIGEYLPLKRAGRNFSGLCPFHSEKTPSFMVNPERQIFRCFGCNEGGDVISFIEQIEGLEFFEALEKLGRRVGIEVVKKGFSKDKQKDKLLAIHDLTARLYHYLLTEHKVGARAREYLANRQISKKSIEEFKLGFAPNSFETILNFLTKKDFGLADISLAGLVVSKGSSTQKSNFYDRFRDRIMFPIYNLGGSIVGFSGRTLDPKMKEAKYINSPETPLFSKRNLLFGLNLAKSAIRENDEAILVEGELDMISSYQAGVKNVVASKGTALTGEQISLIRRFSENLTLCFDMDIAGDAASRRALEIADSAGMNIKIVRLADKDPDELIKHSVEDWKKAIKAAIPVFDFVIESSKRRFDRTTAIGKKKIAAEVLPILAKVTDDVVKAHYLTKLAGELDVPESALYDAISKRTPVGGIEAGQTNIPASSSTQVEKLEGYILALILQGSEFWSKIPRLPEIGRFSLTYKRIYNLLSGELNGVVSGKGETKEDLSELFNKIAGSLNPDELDTYDKLLLFDLSRVVDDADVFIREYTKALNLLESKAIRGELLDLSSKIKEAEDKNKDNELVKYRKRFQDLSQKLSVLTKGN
ncbi:MAG TPA: DNA primase [Patescibacteria group bacterium]